MTLRILAAILEIFGVAAVGWLARRLGYLREADIGRWSRVVIDFLFPLLIFDTIARDFPSDRLAELWPLPFLGLGMVVVGGLAGWGLRRGLSTSDGAVRRTFHHVCAVNNYGFLPMVLVQSLWGPVALAQLFFFNLGSTVGLWTVGVGVLGGADFRRAVRGMFSPSLAAVALALALALTGAHEAVPEIVYRMAAFGGQATIPSMLILFGAGLWPLPRLTDKRDLAYLALVRDVALPALFVAGLLALPLAEDVQNVALIVALMPGAVTAAVLTRRFGGSHDFAARATLVTTALSVATVPLFWMLIELLRG